VSAGNVAGRESVAPGRRGWVRADRGSRGEGLSKLVRRWRTRAEPDSERREFHATPVLAGLGIWMLRSGMVRFAAVLGCLFAASGTLCEMVAPEGPLVHPLELSHNRYYVKY
jgi:hypothetical protein